MSEKTYKPGDWVKLTDGKYLSKDKFEVFRIVKVSGNSPQRIYHDRLLPMGKKGWISSDHVELVDDPHTIFIKILNLAYKYNLYYILNNEEYFKEIWTRSYE